MEVDQPEMTKTSSQIQTLEEMTVIDEVIDDSEKKEAAKQASCYELSCS